MSSNYKQTEMTVYKMAVQLERLAKDNKVPSSQKLCEEINKLEQRLVEKKFRVAVVGEFNRGKSSLINVLLGKRILPEDVLATTATINRVTYGEKPKAYLIMNGIDRKTEDIPVEDLAEYVTKLTKCSALKASEIFEAVVEYPTMLCYNDIDLIDTPGMNDMDDMNAVTVNKLKDIDLAVVVISALMPFSETERNFVINLLESSNICQIIFVVTYIDKVRPRERDRLIPFLQNRICTSVLEELKKAHKPEDRIFQKYHSVFNNIKLYAVSSWEGMDALETNDMELYEKSGYLQLTKDLPTIILNSRSVQLTKNIAYLLETLIDEYSDKLTLQQSTYDMWTRELQQLYNQLDFKKGIASDSQKIQEVTIKADIQKPHQNLDVDFFDNLSIDTISLEIVDEMQKMLCEEKEISKKLLLSLGDVRQVTLDSIRDAMLPTMQSEFSRINHLYREKQNILEERIALYLKYKLQRFSVEIEKELAINPALLSMETTILNNFYQLTKQITFNTNSAAHEIFYFHWLQSPIDITMNTPCNQSVLPGLSHVAKVSLKEGNVQLFQNIQTSFNQMAAHVVKFSDSLESELLAHIHTLKGEKDYTVSVFPQLREIKEQCHKIYSDSN